MSKKKKIKRKKIGEIDQLDIIKSIRRKWFINPVTRVIPNKKKYNRKRDKKFKKEDEEQVK